MDALAASGARVIYTTVGGQLSTHLYGWVVRTGLSEASGRQWVGNTDALQAFSPMDIAGVHTHFGQMLFLAPGYSIDTAAAAYAQQESGPLLTLSLGGLDPVEAQDTVQDLVHISPFSLMQFRLAQDVVSSMGSGCQLASSRGRSCNNAQLGAVARWSMLPNIAFMMITGMAKFDNALDRTGYTGVWIQLNRCVIDSIRHSTSICTLFISQLVL